MIDASKKIDKIEKFYDDTVQDEWGRLERHRLEFELTRRALDEYIDNKLKIADVGCGPGRYSLYLAKNNHKVTSIDLSAENLNFLKTESEKQKVKIQDFVHANALTMSMLPDSSFDVVLCMGPLYHLLEEDERQKAIKECLRILKPGGLILVAFVSIYAQVLSLLKKDVALLPKWRAHLEKLISTGVNDLDFDSGFTWAYFYKPMEIEKFMENFPIVKQKMVGVESLACQSEQKLMSLPENEFQEWVDFLYKFSDDPATLGAVQHILYIGRKQK